MTSERIRAEPNMVELEDLQMLLASNVCRFSNFAVCSFLDGELVMPLWEVGDGAPKIKGLINYFSKIKREFSCF